MELIARLIEIRLYIHRQGSGLAFWMTVARRYLSCQQAQLQVCMTFDQGS